MAGSQPVLVSSDIQWPNTAAQNRTAWLKPVLEFQVHEIPRIDKPTQTQRSVVVARGCRERGVGRDCFMGTEFLG